MWRYHGQERPEFAIDPAPGQESVWDYPRPPGVMPDARLVEVRDREQLLARSCATLRVLETASPPTYYLPERDVDLALLVRAPGRSLCEWKGAAIYWALARDPEQVVAWSYPDPLPAYAALRGAIAFYPGRLSCTLAGEAVQAQPGGFYGGWVTSGIVGPWKGAPGTSAW